MIFKVKRKTTRKVTARQPEVLTLRAPVIPATYVVAESANGRFVVHDKIDSRFGKYLRVGLPDGSLMAFVPKAA